MHLFSLFFLFLLNISSCHLWQPHICLWQDCSCALLSTCVCYCRSFTRCKQQIFYGCCHHWAHWEPGSCIMCFYCIQIIAVVTVTEQLLRHWAPRQYLFMMVASIIHGKRCSLCDPEAPPLSPSEILTTLYQIREVCCEYRLSPGFGLLGRCRFSLGFFIFGWRDAVLFMGSTFKSAMWKWIRPSGGAKRHVLPNLFEFLGLSCSESSRI